MPGPLFSRMDRHFERDLKWMQLHQTGLRLPMLKAKNKAKQYVLDESAAKEAGILSALSPDKLRGMLTHVYAPHHAMWVELPWTAFTGRAASPVNTHMGYISGAPVRVGFLYGRTDEVDETLGYNVFVYYLYDTGKTMFGPYVIDMASSAVPVSRGIDLYEKELTEIFNLPPRLVGLGTDYINKKGKGYKADVDWLTERLSVIPLITPVYANASKAKGLHDMLSSVEGIARQALATLALVSVAHTRHFQPNPSPNPKPPIQSHPRGSEGVTEVHLFTQSDPTGKILYKEVLRHGEKIRKMQHDVGAHYAYRVRPDNQDPRLCPFDPDKQHSWEHVFGKTEECLLCGQRRWFKKEFQRGDPALGVAPKKTYLVHGVKQKINEARNTIDVTSGEPTSND